MGSVRTLGLLVCATALTFISGCAGSGSKNGNSPSPGGTAVSVSISPGSATVMAGQTQQFSATVTGSSNTAVMWSVDGVSGGNGASGTISATGLYTAPSAAGTHRVTATSAADASKSASATVTVTAASAALIVAPSSVRVAAGGSVQFSAKDASGATAAVTWSVDSVNGGNNSVGSISGLGVYTAPVNAGTHTVTAASTANAGLTASAQVLPPNVVFGTSAVLTHHNDSQRTGQNLSETMLTPAVVNSKTFGKLFTLPVDGEVFAQPLYVPNLAVGGGAHNLLIVATEHNS